MDVRPVTPCIVSLSERLEQASALLDPASASGVDDFFHKCPHSYISGHLTSISPNRTPRDYLTSFMFSRGAIFKFLIPAEATRQKPRCHAYMHHGIIHLMKCNVQVCSRDL